jgi:hypothetical protein
MADNRAAAARAAERPVSRKAAAVIVLVWVAAIALTAWIAYRFFAAN